MAVFKNLKFPPDLIDLGIVEQSVPFVLFPRQLRLDDHVRLFR